LTFPLVNTSNYFRLLLFFAKACFISFSTVLTTATATIDELISDSLRQVDEANLRRKYFEQDEFVIVDEFVPREVLSRWQVELETLKPRIHRNYLPGHKKGGSVPYETVNALAPSITDFYHSALLLGFLRRVVGAEMNECPPNDPHRCALYAYTEQGDHMGWHYDTSYYKDRRWTVLAGLKDESSSRLLCHLHTRNPDRDVAKLELQIKAGMLVIFNGDKVYHAVSPLKKGESRYVVSMQYVTIGEMNPFMRFISNMKDAVAYFGIRGVFGKGKGP
jgi:alkylated DNA repair dioxygenase AlkB